MRFGDVEPQSEETVRRILGLQLCDGFGAAGGRDGDTAVLDDDINKCSAKSRRCASDWSISEQRSTAPGTELRYVLNQIAILCCGMSCRRCVGRLACWTYVAVVPFSLYMSQNRPGDPSFRAHRNFPLIVVGGTDKIHSTDLFYRVYRGTYPDTRPHTYSQLIAGCTPDAISSFESRSG